MDSAHPNRTNSSYLHMIKFSLIASTIAGVLFGLFMQMRGMILMIASMVGSESMVLGWTMHMMISWIFGIGFGVMTLISRKYLLLGVIHGILIWMIGPLLVMPIMMGMGPMISEMFTNAQLMSLGTHLGFSLILAILYSVLVNKQKSV